MTLLGLMVVLASQITMGTLPVTGATEYEWEFAYDSGALHYVTTVEPRVDFTPLEGWPFEVRVRADGGPWSEPSYQLVVQPLLGDTDYDCLVSNADWIAVRNNLGNSCP